MSWRNSGSYRGGGARGRRDDVSVVGADYTDGPPLIVFIGASIVLGVLALLGAILFTGLTAPSAGAPAAQPQAAATATPVPAAAPAAPAPTEAPAAAGIPTEALGPALAEGAADAELEVGTDPIQQVFVPDALEAPANSVVSLTFNNLSTVVQHNWVLVDGGEDVATAINDAATAQVAQARNAAAAVPPADTPGLLVAVPILNIGTSYTVTFETPGPGTYTFLCTFPGHYQQGMVGELTVN